MQRSMFRLILASFLSIAISAALGADLSRWSQGNGYPAQGQIGCSCDAPGVDGLVCASPYRCKDLGGLCVGSCVNASRDEAGCSCDAPGVFPEMVGMVCATPRRCKDLGGLCVGHC